MKRKLVGGGLFVFLCLTGCDSVTDPSDGRQLAAPAAATSEQTTLRFADKAAFLQAIEDQRARFTGRTALQAEAPASFHSLYRAQQAAPDDVTSGLLADVPDPALASVLDADGNVFIGDLRYQFGSTEAVAYTAAGNVASRHPVETEPVSETESESSMVAPTSGCKAYGPPRPGGPQFRICGETWNRGYFGIYASQGSRSDHHERRSNWRGWHYADTPAATVEVECFDGYNGSWVAGTSRNNYDTVVIYFDRGWFGTGNDSDGLSRCYHNSNQVDYNGQMRYDSFMTERFFRP